MTKAQRILEAKRAVSRGEAARNEGQFQEAVAMLLDALGLLWTHPANERKCSPQRGAMLKRQGVKPGVPDVLIFNTCTDARMPTGAYKGCAIELKYGKNRVTSEQQHWLDALEEQGWYTAVARSMDEVISILERCGYLEAIHGQ